MYTIVLLSTQLINFNGNWNSAFWTINTNIIIPLLIFSRPDKIY